MCTVSFVPAGDKCFIAHNRDEKNIRPRAIEPRQYRVGGHELLFPRDTQAGGSWIAVNANGAAAVLLNGAFVKHVPQPPYRKSRGLVLLDIIAADDIYRGWQRTGLQDIEPFTVVLWDKGSLYEGRWDGEQKHTVQLDALSAHTWSSVTLYTDTVIASREQWFARWRQQYPQPRLEDMVQYHLMGGDGNPQNDLRMNRDNRMLTVSITAMELQSDQCRVHYLDLLRQANHTQHFPFTKQCILQ